MNREVYGCTLTSFMIYIHVLHAKYWTRRQMTLTYLNAEHQLRNVHFFITRQNLGYAADLQKVY